MKVPVSKPHVGAAEIANVNKALTEGAISGVYGEFLGQFEREFAAFCDTEHAVSCSNGTTALHLAMVASGIKAGDEVGLDPDQHGIVFCRALYRCQAGAGRY